MTTSSTVPEATPSALAMPGALASPTIAALATALAKAQGSMGKAERKTENAVFHSKYADLSSVIDAIGDSLSSNGLSYLQRAHCVPGHVAIETIILHESGEFLSAGILSIPVAAGMDIQSHGLTITYVRRYALSTALGIASTDDDGNVASAAAVAGAVTVKAVDPKPPAAAVAKTSAPATAKSVPATETTAAAPATAAANAESAEAPANTGDVDAESKDLTEKILFVSTYPDPIRLASLKLRAATLFKIKDNQIKFEQAVDKRLLALIPKAA